MFFSVLALFGHLLEDGDGGEEVGRELLVLRRLATQLRPGAVGVWKEGKGEKKILCCYSLSIYNHLLKHRMKKRGKRIKGKVRNELKKTAARENDKPKKTLRKSARKKEREKYCAFILLFF